MSIFIQGAYELGSLSSAFIQFRGFRVSPWPTDVVDLSADIDRMRLIPHTILSMFSLYLRSLNLCTYIYICIRPYMYIYIYVCMYIHVCICTLTYWLTGHAIFIPEAD